MGDGLPHEVVDVENVFIPLADGCRLAARMWLPAGAEDAPVPAILEYIPYRKRDLMRLRDEPMHRYYAAHGYAAVRVDLRGSGDSDGVLADEYLPQEQRDAVEVVEWLAAQPWCDGAVGMTGISWGGFNALQVAALAPAPLRAIITLCASDDRYADDAHYMGGCLLNENQIWGTVLFALNALPPDPEVVGPRWKEMWRERLESDGPFPAAWLRHQHRDAYWRQGSVCEDPSRVRCPVYAIGGWADGYSNAVPRLLAGLSGPRKGLIGPWAHRFPHEGVPGPAIGYLQEALRWWDHWLRGVDNGVMAEPMLRVWMQEHVEPLPHYEERPGRWVAERAWPSPRIEPWRLHLGEGATLDEAPGAERVLEVASPPATGVAAGNWCGFGAEGEAPLDQRGDDGRSLCFDGAPLAAAFEILGAPVLTLTVTADRPVAMLAARLNDVAPDGASLRVTYGLLNLTHRDGHDRPRPLVPGEAVRVRIELNDVAHRFAPGHVVRLALSTAYWPLAWPSPEPARIGILAGAGTLELPVRPADRSDAALPDFAPPRSAPTTSSSIPLAPPRYVRTIEHDLTRDEIVCRLESEGGDLEGGASVHIDAIGLDVGHTVERVFGIGQSDPLSAHAEVGERLWMRRPGWEIEVRARTELTATRTGFRLRAALDVDEGGERFFSRTWDERIPRDLV